LGKSVLNQAGGRTVRRRPPHVEDYVNETSSFLFRLTRLVLAASMLLTLAAGTARAQDDDPNPGAITLTTGIDFPSVYFFRGIRQEADPSLTMFPYGDVGIALFSGDGGLKSAGVNFGIWNSLNTGSSGLDADPKKRIHYEQDFYVSLALGFGKGLTLTPMFTSYTSPNGSFGTVNEILFKVSHASKYAPYGLVAFELSGQADGGSEEGTYAEIGVGPSWPLGGNGVTIGVPIKLGFSLSDYYEAGGQDNGFGYFDIGALVTVPFTSAPTKFGSWNIHGGVNFLALGDGTKSFNTDGDGQQVIASIGIGMTY
jgi:hypothetical protein